MIKILRLTSFCRDIILLCPYIFLPYSQFNCKLLSVPTEKLIIKFIEIYRKNYDFDFLSFFFLSSFPSIKPLNP